MVEGKRKVDFLLGEYPDNPGLDHRDNTPEGYGYAVFGKVINGMDVVDAIANVTIMTKGGRANVPRETITIISIRRVEND